jgi:hypothetical protein
MAIYLPHFSWLAATAIALSSITTTVAAAEYKVLSVGDGDTIRITGFSKQAWHLPNHLINLLLVQ